jgi:hypothetical protein
MSAPTSTWHVDDAALRGWVEGVAGSLAGVSVEQHVLHCAHCRARVARLVPVDALQPAWEQVLAAVEMPTAGPAERLLARSGMGRSDALIAASAVTLRVAWLLGTIGVLLFVVLAAVFARDGGVGLFLVAAPLIPVAGVAAAYGPASDPSYEVVLTAPYSTVRLMLLRTVSVLVTSAPMVVAAGLLLPTSPTVAVSWLLPAIGFVVVVLCASSWTDPTHAAVGVGVAWVATVLWAVRSGDPLVVLSPAALGVYLAVFAVAALTLIHRLLSATPSWRLR